MPNQTRKTRKYLNWGINIILFLLIFYLGWQHFDLWWHNESFRGRVLSSGVVQDPRGQVVALMPEQWTVVVFWASWCGPCRIELDRINDAIAEATLEADQIIAVSIDDDFESFLHFVEEHNYAFKAYWDRNRSFSEQLMIQATPTTVYLDKVGAIVDVDSGVNPFLVSKLKNHFSSG